MKSIELFAGAGGLALGMERAGFHHIGLIEYDKAAAETLKCNRPQWNVICDDIANISCLDLEAFFGIHKGALDVLSGGAPCQSFSYAGKRLGLEDTRGTLFYHYAVFLQKLQPRMFLFENVRGLLTHDNGKTFKTMLSVFEAAGYRVVYRVLNAWHYGVAQKRERLITVGIRNDLINELRFHFPDEHAYKPVLRDVLQNVPDSQGALYSQAKTEIFALVPPGGYWRDIPKPIAKAYMKSCWDMGGGRTGILRRMSLDEPSLAVLTSPSQKQTDRCHPLQPRPFTVRENARIQSFPDEWTFCGTVGEQYRQVGNAVPVNLAYEIANEMMKTLKEETKMWPLTYINEVDFTQHVRSTIEKYGEKLKPITLSDFNSNIIDPIKLIFDKTVYQLSWDEIIKNEIFRQRDKSNNNDIGYFHQRIFQYIDGCTVPREGWDVIFRSEKGILTPEGELVHTVYVEMKNKHNTMNSSSSAKTYIKAQNQLLEDDDCIVCLVEAIAKHSQDIKWVASVDGRKVQHKRIRRVSMDKFYQLITGEDNAFYDMCSVLPAVIERVIKNQEAPVPKDSVFEELCAVADKEHISMAMAVYMLGFEDYLGFKVNR